MSRYARALVLALLVPACGDGDTASTGSTSGSTTDDPSTSFVSATTSTTTTTTGAPTTTDAPTTTGTSTTTTDSSTTTNDTTTTSTSTTSTTTGDTTTGDTTTGDTTSTSDTSTSTGPGDECGDGELDPGEACDDGNNYDFDECKADCTLNECGDGVVWPGEACDDGNDVDDDECTNGCLLPQCGDGVVGPGEACDDGMFNANDAACTLACAVAKCGDGLVWAGMEACDDGNLVDDDDCANDCTAATCSDGQQNGGEAGVDCGGPDCESCEFVLLLGGHAGAMLGGHFDGATWTVKNIPAPTVDGLDVAITSEDVGVGVFRYTKIGDPADNQLRYVTWQAGTWSAPAQIGADTTRAAPTISAAGAGAHAVFHGDNFQHYYARFTAGAWNPTAEMIGSFGPGPGSVTTLGADALLVFHDGAQSNQLFARRRTGAWQAQQSVDAETQAFDRQPAVVTLTNDRVLAVHAVNGGGQLRFGIFDNGAWSAPAQVPGAQTSARAALAPLPGGDAALAFRGLDGQLYVALFVGGAWQAAATVLQPSPTIYGPPALSAGIGDAELELVYLDGQAHTPRHTRRVGGSWWAPAIVSNTALERVAVARSQ
ncbi:DUF4215 domain-containing protein [Nannocystis punicea]|uniref:DUF4215 domain-containing protein n=1 Tax=Nannocystis punicea TaxID=2995304 RepID=A0ABY7H0E5_9BACT|nr:DUF4215 domain-containing protein [Nannocystis poenicansa]WAS92708.1 DUF4215 domain-containing protein [Nannocystis poenicansa]